MNERMIRHASRRGRRTGAVRSNRRLPSWPILFRVPHTFRRRHPGSMHCLHRGWLIALGAGPHATHVVQHRPTETRDRLAAVVVAPSTLRQARHTGDRLVAIVIARRARRQAGSAGERFSAVVIRATRDSRWAARARHGATTLPNRREIIAQGRRNAQ